MNGYHSIDSQAARQSGFSLLEVLIAVVVTSVGLIGLAGMQAAGLNSNQRAYQRSQATVLAYDLADRMRANTNSINSYLTSSMTLAQAVAAGEVAGCKSTTGCSTAQMAQTDLVDWNADLTVALPNPTGVITLDNRGTATLDDDLYTITLSWDDDRNGVVDEEDPGFEMSFYP